MTHLIRTLILTIGLGLGIAACSAPANPTLAPTDTPQAIREIEIPTSTPTGRATAVPSATAMPTAFSSPPTPGEAAIVPILMYHHIQELPSAASELRQTWTVSPNSFDAQMAWLVQRGFHSVAISQLVSYLKQGQAMPTKPIMISFDDGWEEQFTTAFPTLKKHGMIGTFFVYTSSIDHKDFMAWTQLQEMSSAGMDIQAHTLTHPHLRTLAPALAQKELSDSKSILEKRLGKPVVALAYPYGEYNNAVIDMARRAGYEAAVTLAAGYRQRADELLTLHRIRVSYNDTLEDLAKRLP